MISYYIGLIHKDADSDFGVSFPDLPGVIAVGATLDEACVMAEQALAFHVDGLVEDRETIPAASSLEKLMTDGELRSGVFIVTSVCRPSSSTAEKP